MNWLSKWFGVFRLLRFPAVQLGRKAIDEYWQSGEASKDFPPAVIDREAEKMVADVVRIAASSNPLMANREKLTELVGEFAKLQVLILDPPPTADPTCLRGLPGITGELKDRLVELSQADEDLREYMKGFCQAAELSSSSTVRLDVISDVVLLRYRLMFAWTSVFSQLRIAFGDTNPDPARDWFKPWVAACCAVEEQDYREKLGMPLVLGDGKLDPRLHAIMLMQFTAYVREGTRFPDIAWREMAEPILAGKFRQPVE